MVSKAKQASAPAQATNAQAAKPAPKGPAGVLQVKPGLTYRGARAAWYAVLLAHNGKPATAYLETCAATPPSLPKSGKAEPPQGWLAYWVRTGVATLVQPQA
jgi:hypothetical protein